MMMSPSLTKCAPSKFGSSTTPVAAPAISNSSSWRSPGCSAVSPPISAVPAFSHPFAIPETISAMRFGKTFATYQLAKKMLNQNKIYFIKNKLILVIFLFKKIIY